MINYWLLFYQYGVRKLQIIMGKKKRIIRTGAGVPSKKEQPLEHEEIKELNIDEQVRYSSIELHDLPYFFPEDG